MVFAMRKPHPKKKKLKKSRYTLFLLEKEKVKKTLYTLFLLKKVIFASTNDTKHIDNLRQFCWYLPSLVFSIEFYLRDFSAYS